MKNKLDTMTLSTATKWMWNIGLACFIIAVALNAVARNDPWSFLGFAAMGFILRIFWDSLRYEKIYDTE